MLSIWTSLKICHLVKSSLFTKQQFFRLDQIQSICRRQHRWKLKAEILFGMVDNIAGKGENAGYQHFPLFPQCFQKASFPRWLKVGIV